MDILLMDIVMDDGHTCSSSTYFMAYATISHLVSSNQSKLTSRTSSRLDGAAT